MKKDGLAVFDQLPQPIRRELCACRVAVSAEAIAKLLERGVTISAAVEIIRNTDWRMVVIREWEQFFLGD
jgi:hypothetical protein